MGVDVARTRVIAFTLTSVLADPAGKRDYATARWFLRAASIAGFASVVALEAGWIVTEVGRQPWIIQEVMRTEDAVTEVPGQFAAVDSTRRAASLIPSTTVLANPMRSAKSELAR